MSSNKTPKTSSTSKIMTRSRLNKISPTSVPMLGEQVAKLITSHSELTKKLESSIKTSEEEKVGFVNEIKSLELALKMTQEDHKKEISNLKNLCSLMSEEIEKLKESLSKNVDSKTSTQLPINTKKQEESKSSGENTENGRNKTYCEVLKTATNNRVQGENKRRKGRVLLLTSSHGRGCSDLLDKSLKQNYDVQCFFKPSAPINAIVESVREQTKDFGTNDYLIVLGGTNNITEPNMNHLPQVIQKIEEIVPLSQKTNVIISTIPNRFDRPELNKTINLTNKSIHKTINSLKNKNSKQMGICFLNERLKRQNFTNHGLHLNQSGKVIFCNRLADLIESRLQSTVNNSTKQSSNEPFLVKGLKSGKGN